MTAELGGERRDMVLRTDAPSGLAVSHGRAEEFAILQGCLRRRRLRARAALALPRSRRAGPGLLSDAPHRRAWPRAIAWSKTRSLGGDRAKLAERLGARARAHPRHPPRRAVVSEFLPLPQGNPALAAIASLRGSSRPLGAGASGAGMGPAPARADGAGRSGDVVLTHQDFRTGNYMVDARASPGFSIGSSPAWGDPMTDIGWFCARCWRFGAEELEAGGIAPRAPILSRL